MNVVIIGIVPKQMLQRIPRERESTVVVDRLGRRDGKEQDSLSHREHRTRMSDHRSEGVKDESFEGVVVECSESVGHVETMVPGMDVAVEEGVGVEVTMEKVLPGVHDESAKDRIQQNELSSSMTRQKNDHSRSPQ